MNKVVAIDYTDFLRENVLSTGLLKAYGLVLFRIWYTI